MAAKRSGLRGVTTDKYTRERQLPGMDPKSRGVLIKNKQLLNISSDWEKMGAFKFNGHKEYTEIFYLVPFLEEISKGSDKSTFII